MFLNDLGIDFGTANTLIFARGIGIVLNEPSVIAFNNETGRLKAIGKEAIEMIGRTPRNISIAQPINRGVISDIPVAGDLLKMLIRRCHRIPFIKSRIVMGVPDNTTQVERYAMMEAAYHAGARKVLVVRETAAAAIGAELPIHEPHANMIVDIGAGTTEIAVFSLSGVVLSKETRIGGNQFDEAIIEYVEKKYRVIVGKLTAERIKIEIGSACPLENPASTEAKGKSKIDGLPKIIVLTDSEVRTALAQPLIQITGVVRGVLAHIPPELSADISERGILLTGGGALLRHLGRHFSHTVGVKAFLDKNPLLSVVRGTGYFLGNSRLLARMAAFD
jgi:rod shape-determining protein MreB